MNCLLSGVGGQGTVLASKLIARTAMQKGINVRTAETIGMAQRGGCVVSHVRTGDVIHSPLIPLGTADLIIGFEPSEALRVLPYLSENGIVITSRKNIDPVTASLSGDTFDADEMIACLSKHAKTYAIDTEAIAKQIGSTRVVNMILLGAALEAGALPFSFEELAETIKKNVKPQFFEMNVQSIKAGMKVIADSRLKEEK
ncbi:MAG TPA: indolepyruvate oxidoreductase subunit beta [Bacillota bacterium]|nr:indolepyruvate oxidoreductase subunit beta [Bacillota bacterium]HPE38814.1 indolepyruvate oxidoreductase subunit beta [Bacillota bacterium]